MDVLQQQQQQQDSSSGDCRTATSEHQQSLLSSSSCCITNNNNNSNNNNSTGYSSFAHGNATLIIRDLIHSKLAERMMEQQSLAGMGLLSGPHSRDFNGPAAAAINNNTTTVATHHHAAFKEATTAATIMSHLLKVRQEMVALNMSKDSDSDDCRRSESPTHIMSDSELAEDEVGSSHNHGAVVNLGRSSLSSSGGSEEAGGGGGCDLPLSPASEGGHSTESAKEQKASRLENIVGGLVRSSPLPLTTTTASVNGTTTITTSTSTAATTQGCKKRKLYQPIQHETALDLDTKERRRQTFDNEDYDREEEEEEEEVEEEEKEEPELKRKKEAGGMMTENQLRSMQDQIARIQAKFQHQQHHPHHNTSHNDENADPEGELEIDLTTSTPREVVDRRLHHFNEVTIEKKVNNLGKAFGSFGPLHPPHPLLNGSAEPLPPFPPAPQLHLGGHHQPNYVDIAKRFLQDQQDKITKELITKDILGCTINRHADIADKLAAISPELEGLADILKSEITTSLTIIVESIVQRFLAARRQPLSKFADENNPNSNNNSLASAAAAAAAFRQHHQQDSNSSRDKTGKTPSGRAPQVRDRATPRTLSQPLSMANPLSLSNALNTANSGLLLSSACSSPKLSMMLPTIIPDSSNKQPAFSPFPHYPSHQINNNGSMYSDDEFGRDDEEDEQQLQQHQQHQDDALNLVVTPKKRRHKVTDTRITPRTVSRLLAAADQQQPITTMADHLHKHFGGHFAAAGLHHPHGGAFPLVRPPFLPPSLLPTSLGGPDHFPFSPFGFPGHLSAANRPRDLSPPSRRPRSVSPPRDTSRPPPPLLHHQPQLSPDFSAAMKAELERPGSGASSGTEDMRFDTPGAGGHHTAFSLASMAGEF